MTDGPPAAHAEEAALESVRRTGLRVRRAGSGYVLSLPLPLAGSPLKAGLQIIGRKGADEHVCAIAAHFEAALAS